jgi:hypothetical protein
MDCYSCANVWSNIERFTMTLKCATPNKELCHCFFSFLHVYNPWWVLFYVHLIYISSKKKNCVIHCVVLQEGQLFLCSDSCYYICNTIILLVKADNSVLLYIVYNQCGFLDHNRVYYTLYSS